MLRDASQRRQPSQPASTHAEIEAGAAAASVSARAFPDLWHACRDRTRHGHAVAAALHVAERALRTLHRRDKRRCRGRRQHGKNDEDDEGGDRAHAPSSIAHDVPTVAHARSKLASLFDQPIGRYLQRERNAELADRFLVELVGCGMHTELPSAGPECSAPAKCCFCWSRPSACELVRFG